MPENAEVRKKMAKPKIEASTENMSTIGFRVTEAEKKVILKAAYDQGKTLSDYLRATHRESVSTAELSKRVAAMASQLANFQDALLHRMEEVETRLAREIIASDSDTVMRVVDEIYRRASQSPQNKS